MKKLLLFALLGACNFRPMVTRNGDILLGGSVLTKSSSEYASVTKVDGTKIEYARTDGDEISGATTLSSIYHAAKVATNLADNATKQNTTNNVTTRTVTGLKENTKIVKGAQEVEKVRILNPVEEVAPAQ